jgi:hypothetical protein
VPAFVPAGHTAEGRAPWGAPATTAVDYIFKPFDPTELAPRIRGLLERLEHGGRDELRRERFSEVRALVLDDLAARATSEVDFMSFLDALRADLKLELARPIATSIAGYRAVAATSH